MSEQKLKRQLGLFTAVIVVVTSMIGSGIFGNTGFVQGYVGNPAIVLGLWVLGGLVALSGALVYAELATMMPHAGGEYVYLKKIYGPAFSFLTGWMSFIVGFAAPAASAGLLSASYGHEFLKLTFPESGITDWFSSVWNQRFYAVIMVILITGFHMAGTKKGEIVQNILGTMKSVLIIAFTLIGLFTAFHSETAVSGIFDLTDSGSIRWAGLGMGLLFVMFAYSGWNGASYLAEEIRNPEKNLPSAMVSGTLLTIVIYFLINLVYYFFIPAAKMEGQPAVAAMASEAVFSGQHNAAVFFNLSFTIVLLSSLSVSIMIGPRVVFAMARDGMFFSVAGKLDSVNSTPVVSIALQGFLAVLYVITGTYETIMIYMGFALALFPILAVSGMIWLRIKHPELPRPYRAPLFPLVPLFYIVFTGFTLVAALTEWTETSLFALGAALAGIPVYIIWMKVNGRVPVFFNEKPVP